MKEAAENRCPVLLISRNLPPLIGGMERLNLHIARCLNKSAALSVIGPQGCAQHLPKSLWAREIPVKPLWRFVIGTLMAAGRKGRADKPAYVIAGSGLTAPMAWLAARLSGGRAVAYLHGLDIVVDNAAYRRLWLPFLRRCDAIIVNSRNTGRLAEAAGIANRRITVINPGTDIPVFDPLAGQAFREKLGLGQRPLLLSVGRMTARKGLVEFVRRALPEIVRKYPDICLLIIGDTAPNALTGPGTGENARFDDTVAELGLNGNVMKLGVCDDETLSAAYFASTAHIFPVIEKSGDVEGFGMVALEAAAHGLPTVAFDVGGIGDAVLEGKSGLMVRAGDYSALSQRIESIVEGCAQEISPQQCRLFAQTKSWDEFDRALNRCLNLEG